MKLFKISSNKTAHGVVPEALQLAGELNDHTIVLKFITWVSSTRTSNQVFSFQPSFYEPLPPLPE